MPRGAKGKDGLSSIHKMEIAMTAPAPAKPDAGTAALDYYRREAAKPAKVPAPTDLDQMFGYYAA